MAIGQSKLHEFLRRGKLLSDAVAWYDAFTPQLKLQMLDFVREDQLTKEGIDGDGNVIGYYSFVTSLINPKKKFNTHYTLNDTGEFYRSMFVRVLANRVEIDADPIKGEDNLFQKYGSKIIALTDENKEKLAKEIREAYINYARKVLLGTR